MQCNEHPEVNTHHYIVSRDQLPKSTTATHLPMDQSTYDLARSLTSQSVVTANATASHQTQDSDVEKDAAAQTIGTDLEKARSSGTPTKDPFLVQWEEGDKENPMNWGLSRKWFLVVFLSWITLLTLVFAPSHTFSAWNPT